MSLTELVKTILHPNTLSKQQAGFRPSRLHDLISDSSNTWNHAAILSVAESDKPPSQRRLQLGLQEHCPEAPDLSVSQEKTDAWNALALGTTKTV